VDGSSGFTDSALLAGDREDPRHWLNALLVFHVEQRLHYHWPESDGVPRGTIPRMRFARPSRGVTSPPTWLSAVNNARDPPGLAKARAMSSVASSMRTARIETKSIVPR